MNYLKKCIIVTVLLLSQTVLACNPRQIKEQANGTFVYPVECHVEFGKLRRVDTARKKQVEHLENALELKDLAIDTSNKRIQLWQDATYKVEDRLLRLEKNTSRLRWMYFGLGILVMAGATYGASKLK